MLTVTWCRSECCVLSGLDFEATGGSICTLLFVQLFASMAMSHCKHDIGALHGLMRKHLKEHTPPSLADS